MGQQCSSACQKASDKNEIQLNDDDMREMDKSEGKYFDGERSELN